MTRRILKWLAACLAAVLMVPLLAVLWCAVFGWNWARAPLQDLALRKTGRVLLIGGELEVALAWPMTTVRARTLSFANPRWSSVPQMVVADAAGVTIDLRRLLQGSLAFPEVHLVRPHVYLEQASGGRKNWLLDRAQTDEQARIPVGRVTLDQGQIYFADAAQHTAVVVDLSTVSAPTQAAHSVLFKAAGQFHGQPLSAQGSGGAVLAWRDETQPYPIQGQATLGPTQLQARGSVTSLLELSAVDLQIELAGDSLASLYAATGVAFPPTPAYRSSGRLVHRGAVWRYESFVGKVGRSDLAGTLQVDTGGARSVLSGELHSRQLDLADLGPAVGARTVTTVRVLPDLPLDTAHWGQMDADVAITVQGLAPGAALGVEKLQARLRLDERRLTLDPLSFGMAGGQVQAQATLDGAAEPLRGHVTARLRGLVLGRLLPGVEASQARIGRLDGELELTGQGASVGRMLATADGHLRVAAQHGRISRLLMEKTGLHLLEILRLNLAGDRTVALRCALADFDVAHGVMAARTLVLDTDINTLVGSGQVDLAQEQWALTIVPHTKVASLVALRSPIHVRGSFASPTVEVDRGALVARGGGALVLGLLNPLLALIPLFEPGPGMDDACSELLRDNLPARKPPSRPLPAVADRRTP